MARLPVGSFMNAAMASLLPKHRYAIESYARFAFPLIAGNPQCGNLHQVCSQLHSSPLDQRQPHSARSASAGRKALKKIVGNTLVALTHRAPMTGVLFLATSVWSRLQIAVLR